MRLRNSIVIIGLLIAILILVIPVAAQSEGDPERGAQLFAENCVACHGERGEGRIGATLNDAFAAIDQDALIRETVRNGVAGSFMLAFAQENGGPLSDQDIEDIIAYIDTWDTALEPVAPAPPRPERDIPPVEEIDGDPNAGYTIFQTNCAVCHGEDGSGRVGATLTDSFAAIEAGTFVHTTIARGVSGSLMPAWGSEYGGPLSDQELDDVTAYVLTLEGTSGTSTLGEQPGRGSFLPLAIAGGLALLVIIALGVAVNRREDQAR